MIKQFIWQVPFRSPSVCLWIVALNSVRVLNGVMAADVASTCDVELVVENGGRVMHPPLLQVGTLDELVGLELIRDHSPGVPCDRGSIHLRQTACGALAQRCDATPQPDSPRYKSTQMDFDPFVSTCIWVKIYLSFCRVFSF